MKDKKSILGEIKDILFGAEKELAFKDGKSGDFILRVDAEDFIKGAVISLVTPDGLIPVEDGTYPLEDGREIYVIGGKIDKVEMPEEEMIEETIDETATADIEMAEAELLDGTKVKVEGDVAVGNKVLVEKDGEYIKAPEGQHNLSDGRVIYVDADGLINEIQTPETKAVDEEMEAVVEAAPYVDETGEIKKEQPSIDELMERLIKCEEMITEMGKAHEKMSEFSKVVEDKIDTFIKDTPADLEFKSMKSEFNSMIDTKKTTSESNLEAIRNLRAKK